LHHCILRRTQYHARRDAIETWLKELEDGRGEEIVNRVEAERRERKAWCIDADWELVEAGEIVEIVRVSANSVLSRLVVDTFVVSWRDSTIYNIPSFLWRLRWVPLQRA
jgi:hypothetical protein